MPALYGELITNGSFTDGVNGWWVGEPTMMTVATPGTGLAATAAAEAVNIWDALLGQDSLILRKGVRYTVSFTARASQPGTKLHALVGLAAEPYTEVINRTVELGLVDRHFMFSFTSTMDTTDGQVSFEFGQGTPVTVHLTEVRLTTSTVREGFYVDPRSNAFRWCDENPNDYRAPKIRRSIAKRAGARWFGDWNKTIQADVDAYVTAAAAEGRLPILAAYAMVKRDLGGQSAGGAKDAQAYRAWVDGFAAGIGDRPALVIVEPDALAQAGYMPQAQRAERYDLVAYAARAFGALPHVSAYLDGGNATWLKPSEMAAHLKAAGVASVAGLAVGVSNFDATDISCGYGASVVRELAAQGVPGRRFIVDTARNGNGAMDGGGLHVDFCNPAGRRLGVSSSIGVGGAEYLLWVKFPGDSDGQCGVAPDTPAGTFSPHLAERLIDGW